MTARRDLLRECNDKGAPLDEFQTGFCSRCVNPECTRSLFGQSKFDLRVNNWEDRLFNNVPRMDTRDPRYNTISGQRFLTMAVGRTPEIRTDWMDPREVSEPAPVALHVPKVEEKVEPAVSEPVEVVRPPVTPSSRVPSHLLLSNSLGQGVMVGQPPPTKPERDPWATPEPPKDPVVAVGSRIKMGGSGV